MLSKSGYNEGQGNRLRAWVSHLKGRCLLLQSQMMGKMWAQGHWASDFSKRLNIRTLE